uniref:Uncharacterized protein n=1 Tax=Anopheles melas TaxID=34690 RepID=A0A182UG55_9DIPT
MFQHHALGRLRAIEERHGCVGMLLDAAHRLPVAKASVLRDLSLTYWVGQTTVPVNVQALAAAVTDGFVIEPRALQFCCSCTQNTSKPLQGAKGKSRVLPKG